MSVSIEAVPAAAADASLELVDRLVSVLQDDLRGAWLHGGTTFSDRPHQLGDLDLCAVIAHAPPTERVPAVWRADPQARPSRTFAAQDAVESSHGVVFDTTFLLADEMAIATPPSEAFNQDRPVVSWPIFRAHWLAGQYVLLHGQSPEQTVVAPSRAELEHALDRELEHIERHVHEGDAANPYEATYAVWNGCRILYTLETGSAVVSKRSAGSWAAGRLPKRWQATITAAAHSYDGAADAADNELLKESMAPFVAMVRARFGSTGPRPPGPLRWS